MARRTRIAALLCVFAFLAAPMASATLPADNLKTKIKQTGEDLDNANSEVKKALTEWRKAAAALPAAQRKLSAAKAALAKAQSADQHAASELQQATNATNKTESKLNQTRSDISGQEREVSQLVRSMYMQGPTSEISIVLGADNAGDFTSRVAAVNRWNDSKTALIAQLTKNREDLTVLAEQLNALKADKAAKKQVAQERVLTAAQATAEAKAAQAKVDKLVAAREAALAIAKKNRNAVAKRYKALKAEQERLRKIAAGIDDGNVDGGNDLLWPIAGAHVTQYTGWRTHPVYGYRSCHTGIDLGASYGTPIRSAEAGKAVDVGNGGPYGRYTLIAHGDGLMTFYAHQSVQLVKEGDTVKRGEVIGKVGSTGWSTGAHLHWEVRVNGTPWDPMGWFGHSKKKVSCVD